MHGAGFLCVGAAGARGGWGGSWGGPGRPLPPRAARAGGDWGNGGGAAYGARAPAAGLLCAHLPFASAALTVPPPTTPPLACSTRLWRTSSWARTRSSTARSTSRWGGGGRRGGRGDRGFRGGGLHVGGFKGRRGHSVTRAVAAGASCRVTRAGAGAGRETLVRGQVPLQAPSPH